MKKLKLLIATISILFLLPLFFGFALKAGESEAQEKISEQEEVKEHRKNRSELSGPFAFYHRIPDLTEEQVESIKKIRLSMLKEVQELRNQIDELEQRLVTLTGVENVDLDIVDVTIDEIYLLHAARRKVIEHAKQKIRVLLTDEQRLWFDKQVRKNRFAHEKQRKIRHGEIRERRMERREDKLHEQKNCGERK